MQATPASRHWAPASTHVDQDEAQPGSCNGQGKFETWKVKNGDGKMTPIDTWKTELNGFLAPLIAGARHDSPPPGSWIPGKGWVESLDLAADGEWGVPKSGR